MKKIAATISFIFIMLFVSACNFNNLSLAPYLKVSSYPYKTTYQINEQVTYEGLEISDSNGNEISEYSLSLEEGTTLTKPGNERIEVSKSGYVPTYFTIEVEETSLPSLKIASLPNKVIYEQGEYLDLTGLVIKDNNNVVIDEYKTSIEDGSLLYTIGKHTITVTKTNYISISFSITVNKVALKTLVLESEPTKKAYNQNETLDLTGLKVTSEGQEIYDYVVSINGDIIVDADVLKDAGTFRVDITKDGYEGVHFTILVSEYVAPNYDDKNINFYYINDTHGAFQRKNTSTNPYETGMAYLSTYLRGRKAADPNAIILSGGDMFQGGYESNQTKGKIMIDAMNIIDFDAMILGNHEFDWGEETMIDIINRLDCPVLACNVFYSSDNKTRPSYLEPFTIVTKGTLKIGIIGGVEKNIGSSIAGSISSDFYFPSAVPFVKEYSDELRTTYGCDLVVAGFHDGGFDANDNFVYDDLTELSPVTNERYVDGIFLAHDHLNKTGSASNNVKYIESRCNGRSLGNLSFSMKYNGEHYYVNSNSYYNNTSAYSSYTTMDVEVNSLLDKYDSVIGGDEVLCTFSRSYSKEEFATLICEAMYVYINSHKEDFGNVTVYFSCHNTGGVRTSVAAGQFKDSDLTTAMPFDNAICIQTCNSNNISYMINSFYYVHYQAANIVYTGGLTKSVTINYISESETYGKYVQQSYIKYDNITSKDIIRYYLKEYGDSL